VYSAKLLEMLHDIALYKFNTDIDIDILVIQVVENEIFAASHVQHQHITRHTATSLADVKAMHAAPAADATKTTANTQNTFGVFLIK